MTPARRKRLERRITYLEAKPHRGTASAGGYDQAEIAALKAVLAELDFRRTVCTNLECENVALCAQVKRMPELEERLNVALLALDRGIDRAIVTEAAHGLLALGDVEWRRKEIIRRTAEQLAEARDILRGKRVT